MKRGMTLASKESVDRLRETLIQNFSTKAPPQVEVTIPTNPTDSNTPNPPADSNTTNPPTDSSSTTTNTFDLTIEDGWCICGKPDDGRKYVQCSMADDCLGAKEGWFHIECLDASKWSKPISRNKWRCDRCKTSMI